MFTTFISKILIAIIKKVVVLNGLRAIADGFTVYSFFESLRSVHECSDLPKCIVDVSYGSLADIAVNELVDNVGNNRFDISKTESGLYVASTKPILQPTILYPDLFDW